MSLRPSPNLRLNLNNHCFQACRNGSSHNDAGHFLNIILLSRPDKIIEDTFIRVATVRSRKEDEAESISNDVELVIRNQIRHLA
ncbi:hypothetical protein N8I77_011634 [Diaporthe amygdali]|uniref:Uncharacterized protein n=1 Tax=Phomopsis amygdali TaxID=1214568 RepID=A0AAD9W187_PHOAM|nr:hypothetical protein N8I77_011634 [Diaporthe amygdali]